MKYWEWCARINILEENEKERSHVCLNIVIEKKEKENKNEKER